MATKFLSTRGGDGERVLAGGVLPSTPSHAASKPILSHQPRYPLPGATHSQGCSEFGMDARVAVGFSASVVDLPDPLGESSVLFSPLRRRPVSPGVVATP